MKEKGVSVSEYAVVYADGNLTAYALGRLSVLGCDQPRIVCDASKMPLLRIANAMVNRAHCMFEFVYDSVRVSEKQFRKIEDSEEYDVKKLSIVATSQLDFASFVGFCKLMVDAPHLHSRPRRTK